MAASRPRPDDIEGLLAFHRALFGDARMEGDGGDGDGNAGDDSGGAGKDGDDSDKGGFPANTPLAEMTPQQQAAYWQDKARKHEARVKSFGGLTPEQARDLREKAAKHDALERELMSDKDKAVAEATDRTKAEILAATTPKLVAAEFKVAAAGRIDADRLATILEPLDLTKFLTDDGEVDTDKVSKFVDGIAPAKGDDKSRRRGPTPTGHGARGESTTAGGSVASGRDLYRERHNRKTA